METIANKKFLQWEFVGVIDIFVPFLSPNEPSRGQNRGQNMVNNWEGLLGAVVSTSICGI